MTTQNQIPVFSCYGWQRAKQCYEYNQVMKIYKSSVPADVCTGAMDYTHARNESLEALIEDLEESAGIPKGELQYEVEEND